MKRGIALGVLMLAGVATLLAARQADQPKMIQVTKLRDNLYVLKGGGGNTSVFIMSNGVTVVDTKNPGWGQPILDQIQKLTDKPVVRIINTHTHADHVSGNVEFPATVDIVVQENTKTNMMAMRTPTGIATPAANVFKDKGGLGMPKHTFKDRMTIGKGADEIELYYFGRGHTNGDAWVFFPALKVLHAADIFSGKNLPLLDANNGGSGVAIGDSLQKAYDTVNAEVIVTGHSSEMTRDDLKEYAEFNREFLADMRAAKKAGKSVDEEAAAWKIPSKYVGYTIAPDRLKANVQVIYDEIK
jgi:glyoxylase-like metal-dependent hydrolase (beta-lactamase superfamily II)